MEKIYQIGVYPFWGAFFDVKRGSPDDPWCLGMVRAKPAGFGLGSAVIRRFAEDVGPNQQVFSVVVHQPTLEVLNNIGLLSLASEITGSGTCLEITNPSLLEKLPVVKLLKAGRITVDSIEIHYAPSAIDICASPFADFNVIFFGHTI